ncbi:MAG TPA: cytochrome c maturation protein CcmE [Gemmatimonadaceae bacterium]|jgi:cytochrome c-type biogenesis protein CcmE|nr:cytochrome c maturation protein CcmE [Gemmatimonadaceae bacterium]
MAVSSRSRFLLPLGALVVAGGFGYLLWGGLDRNVVYFLTPQELLDRGAAAYDVPVRLGGQVLPGSVMWDARRLELRFTVADGDARIPVHSRGAPPQMFRDGIGVVVEGRYTREGIFESTNLMVKHSNEYRAPGPGEHPRDMYRTLIKGGSE